MNYVTFLKIATFVIFTGPIVVSVMLFVMNKAANKLHAANNIGDTSCNIDDFTNEIKYESVTRLPTRKDCMNYIRTYGGDIYGDNDINANDILYSSGDLYDNDIPDVLPDVDIPLFKPKD